MLSLTNCYAELREHALIRSFLCEHALVQKNPKDYKVLPQEKVHEALSEANVFIGQIGEEKMNKLVVTNETDKENVDILISGKIRLSGKFSLIVDIDIRDVVQSKIIDSIHGIALLDTDEFAMMDINAIMPSSQSDSSENTNLPKGGHSQDEMSSASSAVEYLHDVCKQQDDHPLNNNNNPLYQVSFLVKKKGEKEYKKRALSFDKNRGTLFLCLDEEYQISLENNSDSGVFVRVLVDGLNTLSQKTSTVTRGLEVVSIDEMNGNVPGGGFAPCVSLKDARPWYLKAKSNSVVRGFYSTDNKKDDGRFDSTIHPFVISRAVSSLASRKNYTQQLGIITIAFYQEESPTAQEEPPTTTRGPARGRIGTGTKPPIDTTLPSYNGKGVLGKLVAIFNIHYSEKDGSTAMKR